MVERRFEDDEDDAEAYLDDGGCEHVVLSEEGNVDPIFEVADRQNFFVGVGFNQFFVDSLFEISIFFFGMFKHFFDIRITGDFPFGLPSEVE